MKQNAHRNPTYTRRTPLLLASIGLGVLLAVAGQAAQWNPYMYVHNPGGGSPLAYRAPVAGPLDGFVPQECAFFPYRYEPGRPEFNAIEDRIRYTPDLTEGSGVAYESYLKNNAGRTEHVHDPYTGMAATPNRYRVIGPRTKDDVPCLPEPTGLDPSGTPYDAVCSQAEPYACLPPELNLRVKVDAVVSSEVEVDLQRIPSGGR